MGYSSLLYAFVRRSNDCNGGADQVLQVLQHLAPTASSSLPSLRFLHRNPGSSLRLAQQLRRPSQLPLLSDLCRVGHHHGSIHDRSHFGAYPCLDGAQRQYFRTCRQCMARSFCHVHLLGGHHPLPGQSVGISSVPHGTWRDDEGISQQSQIPEKGQTSTVQSTLDSQELGQYHRTAAATNVYAIQTAIQAG